MTASEYHIVSHWRVRGTPEEAFDVITDAEGLPRWWPAAFTDSLGIQSGDETGEAKVVRLESRGFLPYLLRWHVVADEVERPTRLVNKVWGDFEGVGTWTLRQSGDWTELDHDWRIQVHMPLVSLLSPIFKPLFTANHRWAMARGEQSLQIEMDRRRANNDLERSLIEAPPGGVRRSTWGLAFGAGALVALMLMRRR
jgi:hypothetical protein